MWEDLVNDSRVKNIEEPRTWRALRRTYGMDLSRNSPLSKDVYSGSGGASIKTLSTSLCKTRVLASTRARFVLFIRA